MTALLRSGVGTVAARVNCSRWIADCPWCPNAVGPDTAGFHFGASSFTCSVCGSTTEVLWPSTEMARGIARLLMMRRNPFHRSWEQGETLEDLTFENGLLGVFDNLGELAISDNGLPILRVDGNVIKTDMLPELIGRRPNRELE